MLEHLTDSQVREAAKARIETLERWLRRLIDESFIEISTEYEKYQDNNGNRLIKKQIVENAERRRDGNPDRFPRFIDAVFLDDLVTIICGQEWQRFRGPLSAAFPQGRDVAKEFLGRLIEPRNRLSHANPLSLRQAEQAVCYSGDVIDALKGYYQKMGMKTEYNVPTIINFSDSFGNSVSRPYMTEVSPLGVLVDFSKEPESYLNVGDILTLEVDIDPAFEQSDYTLDWVAFGPPIQGDTSSSKIVISITAGHVGQQMDFRCRVKSNKEWHKSSMGIDDQFDARYRVLPPD
ncbi:hypothetical protein [Ruegeria sp. HKCCD7221]|uniref:hypothetical protein n=1 Tax=Ruegeria sp. HKCCD7221 TaxID=2683009 RepID=UPI001487920B|nr:hypothetical protein [Ruegeria sp. HKCCD7221]